MNWTLSKVAVATDPSPEVTQNPMRVLVPMLKICLPISVHVCPSAEVLLMKAVPLRLIFNH
jgi:hypothetical protein